jgi:hypothetical protein
VARELHLRGSIYSSSSYASINEYITDITAYVSPIQLSLLLLILIFLTWL